ncbi:MAG: hypothetical protein JW709_07415 [Sedimentisphaerales bacterium]|nr:hypothetical protein [Sedimentisphaerales bacterium]
MADKWCELADRNALSEAVRQLNEQDLRYLNRLIVERLKLIGQARSTAMMAHFSVGDRVNFDSHTGDLITGVIIRLNKKTASIATDNGEKWNVHPGFLRPMHGDNIQRNR